MPRHGPSVRRQWASFIAGWLFGCAVLGGFAAVEAVRVAEARATVADGWAAGLAAGVGGALALSALLVVAVLVQLRRRRPWLALMAVLPVVLIPLAQARRRRRAHRAALS